MEHNRRSLSSDTITRAYLDSLLLELRHLDALLPSTELTLYGKTFATPVMTAALSHLYNFCPDGMVKMAEGASAAGAVVWSGMGSAEELERMIATEASVIKIIKPYADRQSVYDKIKHAEKCGALAVGIDIDHSFTRKDYHIMQYDVIDDMPIFPLSHQELADMVKSTTLPFVVKGVLSRQDAVKCLDAGVQGMVISHHNGRLDSAVPPLMILPEILEETGGKVPLFVDCSLQTGIDVFKALAVGASACSVGRPLMNRLCAEGVEGVRKAVVEMTRDLSYAMAMTCSRDLGSIDRSVVRMSNFSW